MKSCNAIENRKLSYQGTANLIGCLKNIANQIDFHLNWDLHNLL